MTKVEFLGLFLGFIIKKSDKWLPEEAPEEQKLDVMQRRIKEHNYEIKKILTQSDEE